MTYYGDIHNLDFAIFPPEGFQIGMVNDQLRFEHFKKAFELESVKNKVVCDLGAGTGILSLEALRQGAKHVYLVDLTNDTIDALRTIVANHPQKDKITIIYKDICELERSDFAHDIDIIVTETFGGDLWNEGMIHYINSVKSIFPDAISIPESACSRLEIIDADYSDWSIWPQIGDKVLIEGYKTLYNGKKFQATDYGLRENFENSDLKEKVLSWTDNGQLQDHYTVRVDGGSDKICKLHHFVKHHRSSEETYWTTTAWFFKELPENSVLKISMVDHVKIDITIQNQPLT